MATWPTTLTYSEDGYGWSVSPEVIRTEFASKNTRQRFMRKRRDEIFTISITADETELAAFETFVLTTLNNGADTYTGPYFTSDLEYTGTLEIINGEYNVEYLSVDYWNITYRFELKNRDFTEEDNIYGTVIALSGFLNYHDILKATEESVNNNNL